ncbi:MAG: phytanoyl-CoA dioxygenase family protein [Filimonas sp.]|nr:phytanoyl-CoA dioxygenase family protein [Filimonas sp.]
MDENNFLNQFVEEGFVIIKNAFAPSLIENWCQLVAALNFDRSIKLVQGNFFETDPELAFQTVADHQILNILERIMGPFVQLDGLTLVIWPPSISNNTLETEISWHRDPYANVPFSNYYCRPLAVNVLSYLQDLDDEIGPLRIIPKSHRMPFTMPVNQRSRSHPLEKLLYLKKGETIIFHNNLVHSRTPNNSSNLRGYVSVYYNLSWLRSSFYNNAIFIKNIQRRAQQNNDRRISRLFGIDDELENRTNSGFMSHDQECWNEWIKEDKSVINFH